MKYKNVEFDAILATPTCGKSYLCDKYPHLFVDVDEVRLRCKYFVPENITREELERTKGNRPFQRRQYKSLTEELYKQLDKYVAEGKTLIVAPHPEAIKYLIINDIKYCFVFPGKNMKKEISERLTHRGHSKEFIQEQEKLFDEFYEKNKADKDAAACYEFGTDEYLEDIIKKFGYKF